MTDTPEAPLTDAEQQKAFVRHMAFNVEAIRSGFFATSIDMMEEMRKNGVPHADAILLTAAVDFTAQLWAKVALQTGIAPKTSRETLEKEVRAYFYKHYREYKAGAAPATKQ